jgi:hypothetical protein
LEIHENGLREALRQEDDAERVRRFTAAVQTLKGTLLATTREDRTCPALDLSPYLTSQYETRLKLPTLDLDRLSPGAAPQAADSEWGFLTAEPVSVALDASASTESRVAAIGKITEEGGPFLVVYQSDDRSWPLVATEKGFLNDKISFTAGHFQGWMIVVDTRESRVLCESRLTATNSGSVSFRSKGTFSTKEGRARDAVAKDLREQFENTASEAIKRMSGDRFRLGYKWLE